MKVWDKREFSDLDDDVELGTRNIKLALRRLRKFARTGAPEELDLDGTIKETAQRGCLDFSYVPSEETRSRCCCSSISAARWIGTSRFARSFFRRRAASSSIWKTSTFTIASMSGCGGQPPALAGDHADLGRAAHLSARLQGDLRGRRLDEPLRDRAPGGSVEHMNEEPGERVARARHAHLSARGVAEPGAGGELGVHPLDPHGQAAVRRADVSADAGGAGSGDAGAGG